MSEVPYIQIKRIAKVVIGGTPTPAEENWNGSIPWATPVDLGKNNGSFISRTERRITHTGVRNGSVIVPAESVILSTRAPIGYSAIASSPIAFNQGCKALVPLIPQHTDSRYLQYALQSKVDQLKSLGKGSTFLELSTSDLASYKIPWPAIEEQTRIADKLDRELAEIDASIADLDLSAVLIKEQFESQREEILKLDESKRVRLSRVLAGIQDGTHGTHPRIDSGGEVLLSAKNISSGELIVTDQESRISDSEATQIVSNGFPQFGDVLMILVGATYGRSALYEEEKTLPFQRSVGFLRPNINLVTSEYLLQVVRSNDFQRQLKLGIKTSAQPGIYLGDVASCRIPLPEFSTQFALTEKIENLELEMNSKLKDISKSINLLIERKISLIEKYSR